jgi:hypothetical protein
MEGIPFVNGRLVRARDLTSSEDCHAQRECHINKGPLVGGAVTHIQA